MIITGTATERSGAILMARIYGSARTLLTQASVSSIDYLVTDITAETTEGSGTLTVSQVLFDTLQLGSLWNKDNQGFNCLWTVPASMLTRNGTLEDELGNPLPDRYAAELRFNLVSGEDFIQIWQFTLQNSFFAS